MSHCHFPTSVITNNQFNRMLRDDVIKWKHFPRYWPFVWGIHRSPVNSPHKGQWRGALMFSLISAWTNSWANHRDAGDLRRHCPHYDVTVMVNIKGLAKDYSSPIANALEKPHRCPKLSIVYTLLRHRRRFISPGFNLQLSGYALTIRAIIWKA